MKNFKLLAGAAAFAAFTVASPAFAQEVKIDNFKTDVNITDSKIINTSAGVRSTAIVEVGSINAKGGSIKVNSYDSRVVIKDSLIVNTAAGVQARSRVSIGSASTD